MIIFIYGEEQYLSLERLRAIKKKYIDTNLGDTNLIEIESKEFNFNKFQKQVMILPFLAKKRLIILKDFLSEGKKADQENVIKILENIPTSTIVLFYESKNPDKRSKIFKLLSKQKYAKRYDKLSPIKLRNWVKEKLNEIVTDKKYLKSGFVEDLIANSSYDMFKLSNQVEKIGLYLNSGLKLDKEQLLALSVTNKQSDIFSLIDKIARKDTQKALEGMHVLIDNGENELYILSMIVYQFRNMLIIKDIIQIDNMRGYKNSALIAKKARLHPFVVSKTTQIIDNFSFKKLKEIYANLYELDCQIKNGAIEPILALDKFIVETTQSIN